MPCLRMRVIVLGYDCWHLLRRLAGPQHSWVSVRAHYLHALHMYATVLGRASYVDNRSVRRELAGCGVRVWMLGL